MQLKSRVLGVLFGALVMIQSAVAAPAIKDPNFETGSAWTTVGITGTGTQFLTDQSNSRIMGGDAYGLIQTQGGATTGANRAGFFSEVTYGGTSISAENSNFGNPAGGGFANNYRFVGIYQEFATAEAGNISFDAVGFASGNNANADPFVFLFNTVQETGTFIRGGATLGGSVFPDAGSVANLNGANAAARPTANLTRVMGTVASLSGSTYTFSNVAAGNWIIGFGYAAPQNAATTYFGGLAISNIVSPNAVPEIDTASAGLPIAIAMLLFFVVSDRRGRKESAVIG